MTRTVLAAGLTFVALALAPAAAIAQTVPLPPGDPVLRTVGTPDGSVLLVRGATTGPYTSPRAALAVQRVTGTTVATTVTTATRAQSALAAFRPATDGSADLLAFSTPGWTAAA